MKAWRKLGLKIWREKWRNRQPKGAQIDWRLDEEENDGRRLSRDSRNESSINKSKSSRKRESLYIEMKIQPANIWRRYACNRRKPKAASRWLSWKLSGWQLCHWRQWLKTAVCKLAAMRHLYRYMLKRLKRSLRRAGTKCGAGWLACWNSTNEEEK